MTRRPIGYYVHHHGAGHLARARVIRNATLWPITLLGTAVGDEGIGLADDRLTDSFDGSDASASRPQSLHYAPLDHPGIRSRVCEFSRWIAMARPVLMVVDVSVEMAMLARLASVPTVYVRLNGQRDDRAHIDAFHAAHALIAPFDQRLELPDAPGWVRAKTFYAPGLTPAAPPAPAQPAGILVILGEGGSAITAGDIAQAAIACPDSQWRVIGRLDAPPDCPDNLVFAGWSDAVGDEIASAAIVIGAAGDGVVGAVMAADGPFICIPEDRAFAEQHATAAGLERVRAAVVLPHWPAPQDWPAVLEQARALDPQGRRALHPADAPARLARWLEDQAALCGQVGATS